MVKRILKTLTNNLGFKILAVIFAFALWLVVYNIDDPQKTSTFTTNVIIENADAVTDDNKYFEVMDGTNTVSFSVTAKRSVLDKLEDSDFTATADMSRLVLGEDGTTGSVEIEISCSRNSSSLKYNGSSKYLKVSLEELMTKQFVVTVDVQGTVAEGYALGDVSVSNPNVLKVSGPASLVSQIASVVATIDVEGMPVSLSDNVVPVLYDADGNEIDTTKLTLSNETVTISAKILNTKEVPLNFSTSGTPLGNNTVRGIQCEPETVRLKGSSAALNPVTSIDIPAEVLDVSGATSDLTTTVDITEYLPEGVELADNSDATVSVTVLIEAYLTRDYTLPASNITVNGLGDAYTLSYAKNVTISIGGLQSDLDALSAADLKGTIDVSGLSEGTHTILIDVVLDTDKYLLDNARAEVVISKKDDGGTGNNGGENNPADNTGNDDEEN